MTLSEKVSHRLSTLSETAEQDRLVALAEAERLADVFADVRPVPYAVPIERFVGMAVECRTRPTLSD